MVLGREECGILRALLEGGDSLPFEQVLSEFTSKIHSSSVVDCCSTLALMLPDKILFEPTERLVGFAILHRAYSSQQPSSNPFISVLVNAASDEEAEKYERSFILQLLGSTTSTNELEVLKLSAADYIRNFDPSSHTFPPREQLQQQYCGNVLPESYATVKNTFPNPDVPPGCDINSPEFDLHPGVTPKIGSGDRDETISELLSNLSLKGLGAQWIRPRPPRLPVVQGELMWLNPEKSHELQWDHGMSANIIREKFRYLIKEALKGPFETDQQKLLLDMLETDPKLVHHCGMTAKEMEELVDKNPVVAVEVLKLANSPEMRSYVWGLIEKALKGPLPPALGELVLTLVENDSKLVNHFRLMAKAMGELVEKSPDIAVKVLSKLANSPEMKAYIRVLIENALKGSFAPNLEQLVLTLLANDPKLVNHCGLTAKEMEELEEKNPAVAVKVVEALTKLANSPEIEENFITLAHVGMSLQVKVVDRLTKGVELAPQFINQFIRSCVPSNAKLEAEKSHDGYATLACVFLQTLIQKKIINVQALFIEVQVFCIEFQG